MSILRFVILLFISYALFTLSVAFYPKANFNIEDFGTLIGVTLLGTVLYIFGMLFFQSISNISKFIFWILVGEKNNILVIFPFIIFKDLNNSKYKISVTYDLYKAFDTFYPESFIKIQALHYDSEKVKKNLIRSELSAIFVQLAIYIMMSLATYRLDSMFLLLSVLLTILPIGAQFFIKATDFHGALYKVIQIKRNKGVYYLADAVIMYVDRGNEIFRCFENTMLKDNDKEFLFHKIKMLQHMFMIKCQNNFKLEPSTVDFINRIILDGNTIDVTTIVGGTRFDFLKVYMCCAMLNQCDNDLSRVLSEMDTLKEEQGAYFGDVLDWYIFIGRYNRMTEQNTKFPNKVIRIEGFFMNFKNYYNLYHFIRQSIEKKCLSHHGGNIYGK